MGRLENVVVCGSGALALLLLASCGTTAVTQQSQYYGAVPRPSRIVVLPFVTSPEEVTLDRSPTVALAWKSEGISASEERREVGRQVANALANELVTKIQELGLPAERSPVWPPPEWGSLLVIDGAFLSVDEGTRALRLTIGLGAGASDVRTAVQVYDVVSEGRRLVDSFDIDAKSGRKPGAAETMGAGAAAGHLAASAAVTVAGSVASEAFGDNVEADARRTAEKISKLLSNFFVQQGWIPPPQSLLP